MEISEYQNIFENEASHFFYVANHKIILSLVKKCLGKGIKESPQVPKILDAGCGTGLLTKKLEQFGKVWGIDQSPEAVKFAKSRSIRVKQASLTRLPFKNNSFDLVVCIDVLTHQWVNDDKKALREIYRVLKPDGWLILRVSANKWLKLPHDRHVFTKERYHKGELFQKLTAAHFEVKKISFTNPLLFPPAIIISLLEKFHPAHQTTSAIKPLPKPINSLLAFLLCLEAYLLPKINLPFGLALITLCRKKDTPRNCLTTSEVD